MATTDQFSTSSFPVAYQDMVTRIIAKTPADGTLVMSWALGASPDGGYLRANFVNVLSPSGISQITINCGELITGAVWPLQYLCAQPTGIINRSVTMSQTGSSGPQELAGVMVGLLRSIAMALCGASATPVISVGSTIPGNSRQTYGFASCLAVNDIDNWPIIASISHIGRVNGIQTYTYSGNGVFGQTAGTPAVVSAISMPQQALPDIDLAINNGSAIYSIMSNTITEG